jgi:hypothetical protein
MDTIGCDEAGKDTGSQSYRRSRIRSQWFQATEILGITDGCLRHWPDRYEQEGNNGRLNSLAQTQTV